MSLKLYHATSQSVPEALLKTVDSGTTAFLEGALLLKQADDEWAECGADPTEVSAVALHPYGANTAVGALHGRKEFPSGKCLAIPVKGKQFRAKYVGTPALGAFGAIKDSDNYWKVDFNETTTDVFQVLKILSSSDLGFSGFPEVVVQVIDSVATQL